MPIAGKTMQAQTLPSIADKIINIQNGLIAYKDSGLGVTVLCLQAVGHSSSDFASLYQLPSDKYRIIALDLPGHGRSGKPTEPVSASYFSAVAESFISRMELREVVIVGNSIGGAAAIKLAANNPNIKALALADPGGLDKRDFIAPLFLAHMVGFFKSGSQRNPSFMKRFEKYYNKVLPSGAAASRRKEIAGSAYAIATLLVEAWQSFGSDKEDLRPLIKSIHCPVLFTWGTRDKFVRLSRNKQAIQNFKNYKLVKYPIGHTPYLECPEEFFKDFRSFLEQQRIIKQ